jgi:hypothetical protein
MNSVTTTAPDVTQHGARHKTPNLTLDRAHDLAHNLTPDAHASLHQELLPETSETKTGTNLASILTTAQASDDFIQSSDPISTAHTGGNAKSQLSSSPNLRLLNILEPAFGRTISHQRGSAIQYTEFNPMQLLLDFLHAEHPRELMNQTRSSEYQVRCAFCRPRT